MVKNIFMLIGVSVVITTLGLQAFAGNTFSPSKFPSPGEIRDVIVKSTPKPSRYMPGTPAETTLMDLGVVDLSVDVFRIAHKDAVKPYIINMRGLTYCEDDCHFKCAPASTVQDCTDALMISLFIDARQ